jgi:hypothetical protein
MRDPGDIVNAQLPTCLFHGFDHSCLEKHVAVADSVLPPSESVDLSACRFRLLPSPRLRPTAGATSVRAAVLAVALLVLPSALCAEERYALIVSGATGGPNYVQQYTRWTQALSQTLVEHLKLDPSRVVVLSEATEEGKAATAVNIRAVFGTLRQQMQAGDLLFIFLLGHGTFDGVDAKFNLPGPDLASAEWAALLRGLPGRMVVVNTAAASFPFVERLAGPRRVVISATDSVAQRFDTVFPEYFIAAFRDQAADIDKNGRISVWEAFASAAGGVRRYYQQRGQLSTERSLLDDNGDGIGREAAAQGDDGSLASRTYLDAAAPDAPPTDEILVDLLQRRASLSAEIEELQVKKVFMAPDEYAREFERVVLALARVARDIRARSKT